MTADKELKAYIDRVLRLKEEQDALTGDIREVYSEAKMQGYDKTAMGKVVAYLRKIEKSGPDATNEEAMVFDTYLNAYERASGTSFATHTHETDHDLETGEVREVNPRLIKQVVDGLQTEAGRAALITAVDIMIDREEAEQNTPSDDPHASVSTATPPPVAVKEEVSDGLLQNSEFQAKASDDACEAGRKALGRAESSDEAPVGAELVSRVVDGRTSTATSEITDETAGETALISEHSVIGGDHEVAEQGHRAEAGHIVSTSPAHKPLRPHCLRPGQPDCGGYGDKTCHACLVAARTSGEAA